ncbi:MAG: DUF1206 domain-containing protein [Candidatus Marinimicrobia bacterium]|nr:DUF1206 domain-containing protein [Candidatus Neomarinimicrobiota bacterium]MBL7047184.1 DUF1206 domain-containing protein [Candidatus Neomarinimicrobiota bacterium]
MNKIEKKRLKTETKIQKKLAKAKQKEIPATNERGDSHPPDQPSHAVRFAEGVRGTIYVIFAASLLLAIILGQRGVIVTLEDIIGSLFLALIGKIILVIVALALFIYGLKHLRLVK